MVTFEATSRHDREQEIEHLAEQSSILLREMLLENERLRGQIKALEEIVIIYRDEVHHLIRCR